VAPELLPELPVVGLYTLSTPNQQRLDVEIVAKLPKTAALPRLTHPLPSFLFILTTKFVRFAGVAIGMPIVTGLEKATAVVSPMVMSTAPAVELIV